MEWFAGSADETGQSCDLSQAAMDYARVERALRYLDTHARRRPSLEETARHVHLSPFHFERLFQRWAGTSPKRFLQFLSKEYAKALLRDSASAIEAAYESGLSGAGRLHDLLVTCEAVTPGECKARGKGLVIRYGTHPTPFGECLMAVTDKGITALRFAADGASLAASLEALREEWVAARFVEAKEETAHTCREVFSRPTSSARRPIHLLIRGTNFQLQVWQALVAIPAGQLVSYRNVAMRIGMPRAARAVGGAVGRNPIAYLIPCHRVIQSLGGAGGYRWGSARKTAMIGRESAQLDQRRAER